MENMEKGPLPMNVPSRGVSSRPEEPSLSCRYEPRFLTVEKMPRLDTSTKEDTTHDLQTTVQNSMDAIPCTKKHSRSPFDRLWNGGVIPVLARPSIQANGNETMEVR